MSKNLFNSIQVKRPQRNKFDLTHDVKLTTDMGWLVPTLWLDCVPGDKFSIGCDSLIKFLPMVAPVMHRMSVFMHYWFVPYRLLWGNWEKFIVYSGSSVVPGGSLPNHPYIQWDTNAAGYVNNLGDYLGLPDSMSDGQSYNVNAFPMAAYQKIWNDYYRDQNLIPDYNPPGTYILGDGDNTAVLGLYDMHRRAWQHDYFTSCLPWAQKGESVALPVAGFNDVPVRMHRQNTAAVTDSQFQAEGIDFPSNNTDSAIVDYDSTLPNDERLYAMTSELGATATSINDLRRAYALQRWLELNARGGTRYAEHIYAQFGVKSSDKRLQRAEYITGTKSPVIVSEVLNTTGETAGLPQGNMSGHGVSVTSGSYGHYFCEEHGLIMGIMSVMPLPAYQDGIHRSWFKTLPYDDYYWKEFANIGEQAVLNRELYAGGASSLNTFGYIPRYSEYKFMPNRVAGNFRNSLSFWGLQRQFASPPALNQEFIECKPRKDIFAVSSYEENSIVAQVLHRIIANRPMPKYGTPMY